MGPGKPGKPGQRGRRPSSIGSDAWTEPSRRAGTVRVSRSASVTRQGERDRHMRVRFSKGLRIGAAMVGMCLAGVGCQTRGMIAGLHDGATPQIVAGTSGPILSTETGETVQVVEPSASGGGRVIASE